MESLVSPDWTTVQKLNSYSPIGHLSGTYGTAHSQAAEKLISGAGVPRCRNIGTR